MLQTNDRIRVLHSLAPPDGTTKYVDQMTEGAPDAVDVSYFSWRRALRGDYDVLHVHWPEFLLRARSARKRLGKRQAMRATLLLARARRIPIVRTVHNLHPHESGGSAERRILRAVDRQTDVFIRLNPTTELEPWMKGVTILHGHYRDRFAHYPRSPREPGRILYFGIIRPYKNVERLIAVYGDRDRPGTRLRVVGSPSPDLRDRISALADAHPSVSARLAFVEDRELVEEISAASLVVLPYAEMHNSGAALVALSMDRPILVPRTPSNTALADEVGEEWVIQYTGELTDEVLTEALDAITRIPEDARPRLDGRDWDEVGRRHHEVYLEAIASKARR
jgi:beta-1,4-mannosyltransferase